MVQTPADVATALHIAAIPGTCGELFQGTLDGVPCLVSCPIASYSRAEVCFSLQAGWRIQPEAPKVRQALRAGLATLAPAVKGGSVCYHSTLPQGRGYGSSTADIGAVLYALGQAAGTPLSPLEVARLAVQVEPTDSSLFPGLALWDHRHGSLYQDLGPAPALPLLILDPGGEVDTLAFNQRDHRPTLQRLLPLHREAFSVLQQGLQQADLAALGYAATLSATAHQAILANPLLDLALSLAREVHALGVCRAHSGTILGLLLEPRTTDVAAAAAFTARRCGAAVTVLSQTLQSGGMVIAPPSDSAAS
ncbi:MAG: GHMP kinase [Candidatus Tectimicrobiota bacterium]